MISFVTCIFNRAKFLDRTLFTIAKQEHKYPWEIVLIDDGSTDNLYDVLKKWKYLPIRTFRLDRPQYANVAWPQNCGIKLARGEHILYASPEVMHFGNTLDFMHEYLDRHNHFIFATVYGLEQEDNRWLDEHTEWQTNIKLLQRFNSRGHLCGPKNPIMLYFLAGWRRQEYIDMGGMDERFKYVGWEDTEFMERVRVPINRPDYYDSETDICGYHQWHERIYGTARYARFFLQSQALYKALSAQHRAVANQNKNWGIIPLGAEVDLETL